jgi:hypothetical protein
LCYWNDSCLFDGGIAARISSAHQHDADRMFWVPATLSISWMIRSAGYSIGRAVLTSRVSERQP